MKVFARLYFLKSICAASDCEMKKVCVCVSLCLSVCMWVQKKPAIINKMEALLLQEILFSVYLYFLSCTRMTFVI